MLRTATVGRGSDHSNRLIRLRGPLPVKEGWRGEWADDSRRWTPEALSSLQAAAATAECAGRNTPEGLNPPQEQQEQEGGQAFWVSLVEVVSSFVEAGVCFAPSPGPVGSAAAAAGGADIPGKARTNGVSGWWAQEARRRVTLRQRKDTPSRGDSGGTAATAASSRKAGAAVTGRNRGRNRSEGCVWAASQVYALSVYKTSRMFFSLHQVRGGRCSPLESQGHDDGVVVPIPVGSVCTPPPNR